MAHFRKIDGVFIRVYPRCVFSWMLHKSTTSSTKRNGQTLGDNDCTINNGELLIDRHVYNAINMLFSEPVNVTLKSVRKLVGARC